MTSKVVINFGDILSLPIDPIITTVKVEYTERKRQQRPIPAQATFLAIDSQGQIFIDLLALREWAALGEGIFLFVPRGIGVP